MFSTPPNSTSQPQRCELCALSVAHPCGGAEGSPAQFPYLIRVLDNDPANGALQGRKKGSEITALQPPTPLLAEESDCGHWLEILWDPLATITWTCFKTRVFTPQRNWSMCSTAGHIPALHFNSWVLSIPSLQV